MLTAFLIRHSWLTIMLEDQLYAAPIGDAPQVGLNLYPLLGPQY